MIKKTNKSSRSWTRILAVQAMYQLSLNKDSERKQVIKQFLNNQETKNKADKIFFSQLIETSLNRERELEKKIIYSSNEKKYKKMEILIKVILILGACEIIHFKDIPYKTSIAEYNKVGNSFLNKKEVGLINAILNTISKKFS